MRDVNPLALPAVLLALLIPATARAAVTAVTVRAAAAPSPALPFLVGSCIEDVNHEIYGGLYGQMIFGESFQEPPAGSAVAGFRDLGGLWVVRDGAVQIDGADGPKLVSDRPPFADGTVDVDVRFPDRAAGNAGLLVRLQQAAVGADAFAGYEVSIDPGRQVVRLARHRNDFNLIADVPAAVPVGQWVHLQVQLDGPTIEILVDGKTALRRNIGGSPPAGTVALRAWHATAAFRNLSVTTTGRPESLPLDRAGPAGAVSGQWRPSARGTAVARYSVTADHPFVGSQSQVVTFDAGDGEAGVANRGLNGWGMNLVAGRPYEGHIWARADKPTQLVAALDRGDGSERLAERSLDVPAGDWRRLDFALTPTATDRAGRFTLGLTRPGSVTLGYAFLQPGEWGRFRGLPVRRDVVEGLIDQGVGVLRYGGSMVNSPAYRWKDMLGPRDRRPPYAGTWYPYSSNGWGVVDFLNLCEAAGIVAVPDLNVNETPADIADFVQYANGPVDTPWGRRRAADGDPAPYRLRYLELGNEERVDTAYAAKFNALADAAWSRDPNLIPVVGDFGYKRAITDPDHVTGADGHLDNLDGQRQILDHARRRGREVWFDVHVWSESLSPSADLVTLPTYIDAIDRLANGARHRVVVFELNANSHGQKRALANAVAVNTLRRDGRVPVVTSANGLQPDGQNDNGWDQGLLFLNPWQVWLQPPGYAMQMQARNALPRLLRCDVTPAAGSHLDVTATASTDGKQLVVQVVNTGPAEAASIALDGFTPVRTSAHVTELTDPSNATNPADQPRLVVPTESDWTFSTGSGPPTRTFPAHSFTVIRFD